MRIVLPYTLLTHHWTIQHLRAPKNLSRSFRNDDIPTHDSVVHLPRRRRISHRPDLDSTLVTYGGLRTAFLKIDYVSRFRDSPRLIGQNMESVIPPVPDRKPSAASTSW